MNAYKAHELRMWTIQVIIPATALAVYVWNETNLFRNTKAKIKAIKQKRQNRKAKK